MNLNFFSDGLNNRLYLSNIGDGVTRNVNGFHHNFVFVFRGEVHSISLYCSIVLLKVFRIGLDVHVKNSRLGNDFLSNRSCDIFSNDLRFISDSLSQHSWGSCYSFSNHTRI